jgi:hypothetical protein
MARSFSASLKPPPDPVAGAVIGAIIRPIAGPIIGVDVGEDFLDLAVLSVPAKALRMVRIAVIGVDRACDAQGIIANGSAAQPGIGDGDRAICELQRRLLAAAPELNAGGAIVLIDSPRWPRDLHPALPADDAVLGHGSAPPLASRAIDTVLRAIVRRLLLKKRDGAPFRLALFPTPKLEFFAACARDPRCKPHLVAIARELFGPTLEDTHAHPAPVGGRLFTRFMLTGFAIYSALEQTAAQCFEAYPDLAFRLWAHGEEIPPKSAGRTALDARNRINRRLADELHYPGASKISTLDQADAAVLALSAAAAAERAGVIALIEQPGEGRFALAMDPDQARRSGYAAQIK